MFVSRPAGVIHPARTDESQQERSPVASVDGTFKISRLPRHSERENRPLRPAFRIAETQGRTCRRPDSSPCRRPGNCRTTSRRKRSQDLLQETRTICPVQTLRPAASADVTQLSAGNATTCRRPDSSLCHRPDRYVSHNLPQETAPPAGNNLPWEKPFRLTPF